jgi:hypothetical protein
MSLKFSDIATYSITVDSAFKENGKNIMLNKFFGYRMFPLIVILFDAPIAFSQTTPVAVQSPICHECISIRIGVPRIEQGPRNDVADANFSEVQLPNGSFRGFTAAGVTYAIDGNHPAEMNGPLRNILGRGGQGTFDSCGQWIQHTELVGKVVFAWVHDETACNYKAGQTHMSTSLSVSEDYGLTWKYLGQIINDNNKDTPKANKMTGEGNCSALDGRDGYYYAYCQRMLDHSTILSRAPVSDPSPGNWMNVYQGDWSQPGVGGDATPITKGASGAVARWTSTGETLMLGWTHGGMGLRFSNDRTNFSVLQEPILVLDNGSWGRPDPTELISYQALIDAATGRNQLSNAWLLTYMYVQPNEGFDKRYLVFRDMNVSVLSKPVTPQVGVALARWYNSHLHDRWSTTAPVPPASDSSYKLETTSGFLMTVPNAGGKATVELEDCVSQWPGHPDHMLDKKGACEAAQGYNFQRLRTAGFVYTAPQDETVPLYRCYNAQDRSHFASNQQDCEQLGTMEHLLGYVLSK